MITNLLIALAAGAASALMFASIVSGALISLLLFYLAPLPLMMAALGWGATGAAIGGIVAGVGLGAIFGLAYFVAFTLTVTLPAWWLGHLVLLGRSPDGLNAPANAASANGATALSPPALEWYPTGRVLVWTAGFASLTTISALLTLGFDADSINGSLRRGLMRVIGIQGDAAVSTDTERLMGALVRIAPGAATIVAMMTLTLNLWLATRIIAASGRLRRPWPDIRATTVPPMTLAALSLAIALCFTGGLLAICAQIVSSALMMAYALTGFATLHIMTLTMKSRALWLGLAYATVMLFGWPVFAVMLLGLTDAVFGFRERIWRRQKPPAPV